MDNGTPGLHQISASTQTYYQTAVQNSTGNNLTNDVLTTLISSILGSNSTGLAKGNSTNISNQLSSSLPFGSITAPDANNLSGSNPKAYMTIMFFDERFNYVGEGSTFVRVEEHTGDGAPLLVIPAVKAPKNGYAYVYLSNESNEPVYFDNFVVNDNRGRIIEEDHYYSYGLKIAGISSKKLDAGIEGSLKNNNLYNDKELFDDGVLDWYDYGFRNYDPQIGRFIQLDPLTDDYPELTNYQYASCEPIANIDMDGLEKQVSTVGGMWTNGSFLQTASKATPSLGRTILTGAASVISKEAAHKIADSYIEKIFEEEIIEEAGINLAPKLGGVGIFLFLLLSPDFDSPKPHQEFPDSWYKKQLNPQPLPSPKFNPKTNKPKDDEDDFASVRFQVQSGKDNVSSKTKKNKKEIGVLKRQGYNALDEIYTESIENDPSLKDNKDFRRAIIKISQKIKKIVGGISKGRYQTDLQEIFKHKGKEYRIDVEVQRGINFKKW